MLVRSTVVPGDAAGEGGEGGRGKGEEHTIHGAMYNCASEAHWERLVEYESAAYTWCVCEVRVINDEGAQEEVLQQCRTFCWAGDASSRELEDGTFNLAHWQRYFKRSVVRERG